MCRTITSIATCTVLGALQIDSASLSLNTDGDREIETWLAAMLNAMSAFPIRLLHEYCVRSSKATC